MSIEDNIIRFEGMDPARFRQAMADLEKVLTGITKLSADWYALVHEFNTKQREWR